MDFHYEYWPYVRRLTGKKTFGTVARWENAGLFPKRHKLGPNSTAWRSDELAAWAEDPEGWAAAHKEVAA